MDGSLKVEGEDVGRGTPGANDGDDVDHGDGDDVMDRNRDGAWQTGRQSTNGDEDSVADGDDARQTGMATYRWGRGQWGQSWWQHY